MPVDLELWTPEAGKKGFRFSLKIQYFLCFKVHADTEGNERNWERMSSAIGFAWIIETI